jgi:RHS repeat-associated protein
MQMPGRKYNVGVGAYRYGFNGKDKDKDISEGDLDFGARIYDNRLGRWLGVDPLYKKHSELTPFHFCNNNPILYIDLDGMDFIVNDPTKRDAILSLINAKALGSFAFDNNGKLYLVNKDGKKGSTYYRDALIKLIDDHSKVLIVDKSQKYLERQKDGSSITKDVDNDAGGGVTSVTKAIVKPAPPGPFAPELIKQGDVTVTEQTVTISGNENKNITNEKGVSIKDDAADILVHEIVGHVIANFYGKTMTQGNAITEENKVRKENNQPQRKADPKHKATQIVTF